MNKESENKEAEKELTKSNKKQKTGNASIPEIMASHKELLKEDLANEELRLRQLGSKAKGEVDLGTSQPQAKRPRLLGPILNARFPVEGNEDKPERERRTNELDGFYASGDEPKTKKPRLSGAFQCGLGDQPSLQKECGELEPCSWGHGDKPRNQHAGSGEMQPDSRGSSSSR